MVLNNAQLNALVLQLQEQVKALNPEPTLLSQINELRALHDRKLHEIKENYESRIKNLEIKLEATIKATSSTTIECVSGFFKTLDVKIEKLTMELDVFKNDENSQVNLNKHGCFNLKKLIDDTTVIVKKHEEALNQNKYDFNDRENCSAEPEIRTSSVTKMNNTDHLNALNKPVTLASLEARIDKLEDFSRRDNILFHGFPENKDENVKMLSGTC